MAHQLWTREISQLYDRTDKIHVKHHAGRLMWLNRVFMIFHQALNRFFIQKKSWWLSGLIILPSFGQAEQIAFKAHLISRLKIDRHMIESSLEPIKKHLLDLTVLEKQRSSQRDYEGALAALKERKRIEAQLEQLDRLMLLIITRQEAIQTAEIPDKIFLPLESAQLNGVRRESGELSGWNLPGSTASWKLPNIPSGGYEVFIRYRCSPLEGGVLEVKESKFSITSQIETTLKGPQQKKLGTLKITTGNGPFTLTGKTLLKGNLMNLLELWLIPANH